MEHSSFFQDQQGPQPWQEDERLIRMLLKWLDTTCLLRGHELHPATRMTDPDAWRQMAARRLARGRSYDTLAIRDHVLRAIEQTEPELAGRLPEPQEHLPSPDAQIAESAA